VASVARGPAGAQDYTVAPAARNQRAGPTAQDATIRDLELRTTTPEETREVAGAVAGVMRPGDVIALTGEIGAGKTCFVQGAARALGVTERVTSPSYILRKEYRGDVDVLHLDVYRLESLQEVLDIGFAEAGDTRAAQVTFVEWGDAMAPLLPSEHLEVELRLPPLDTAGAAAAGAAGDWAPEPRTVVLRAHGPDWSRRLGDLQPMLDTWADGAAPC
jgi:tRNA threonylcarbamoyladenosine biosynthesis protein TsaE